MKTPLRSLSTSSVAGNAPAAQAPSTIRLSGAQSSAVARNSLNDRVKSDKGDAASTAPLLVLRFPFDVSNLQSEHRQQLDDFAGHTWPDIKYRPLEIVGFTDDTGPQQYNDLLARRRAESVVKALQELGIDELKTIARGKCCYLSTNDTPQGRADNRRVEIRLSTHHENTRSRADEH
jgi:outer membrane protein OmpA-like peptidoglycan-associated protein